ncbi:hypothetical protein PHAVU_009G217250 [Phaseolus vulgaris]
MGLKGSVCVGLFLSLNLLSLSIVTSQTCHHFKNCAFKVVHDVEEFQNPFEPCCEILVRIGAAEAGSCVCYLIRSFLPHITRDTGLNLNDDDINDSLNRTLALCGLPNFGRC